MWFFSAGPSLVRFLDADFFAAAFFFFFAVVLLVVFFGADFFAAAFFATGFLEVVFLRLAFRGGWPITARPHALDCLCVVKS